MTLHSKSNVSFIQITVSISLGTRGGNSRIWCKGIWRIVWEKPKSSTTGVIA